MRPAMMQGWTSCLESSLIKWNKSNGLKSLSSPWASTWCCCPSSKLCLCGWFRDRSLVYSYWAFSSPSCSFLPIVESHSPKPTTRLRALIYRFNFDRYIHCSHSTCNIIEYPWCSVVTILWIYINIYVYNNIWMLINLIFIFIYKDTGKLV